LGARAGSDLTGIPTLLSANKEAVDPDGQGLR
jgi:hypothetical protein